MQRKFIATNFAYGTGPYLRTNNLALLFNDELEKRGKEKMQIIVPLVYGEKQKRIMEEEFGKPKEIVFDEKLGKILGSIFYGNNTYSESLEKWATNCREASRAAHE